MFKSYYTEEQLYTIMYQAEHSGAYVSHIRGKICLSLDDFFREVSSSMRFPYYFGWNWAAFDECITDLDWLTFSNILIVIDSFDSVFHEENNQQLLQNTLIRYLRGAVEYWKSQNITVTVYLNYERTRDD